MVYSQGTPGAGSVVLCDGIPMESAEIVGRLTEYEEALTEFRRLARDLHVALHDGDQSDAETSLHDLIESAKGLRATVLAAAIRQMGIR